MHTNIHIVINNAWKNHKIYESLLMHAVHALAEVKRGRGERSL